VPINVRFVPNVNDIFIDNSPTFRSLPNFCQTELLNLPKITSLSGISSLYQETVEASQRA